MHEEQAWLKNCTPLPSIPTAHSIDLYREGLCTTADTSVLISSLFLNIHKMVPGGVIHFGRKGCKEEVQVSSGSLSKESQGLENTKHGLEVGVWFWLGMPLSLYRVLALQEEHGQRRTEVGNLKQQYSKSNAPTDTMYKLSLVYEEIRNLPEYE